MGTKKIIIFDLDGTLAYSKSCIDTEMGGLVARLLEKKKVAVISGGPFKQYDKQLLANLKLSDEQLKNLYLFPTCSTTFYRYEENGWKRVYAETLRNEEKQRIMNAFEKTFIEIGYKHPEKIWGEVIEDRETQITFSAHGQEAPLEVKRDWDPDRKKRMGIKKSLEDYIPEFEIRLGGTTSIDITYKGIDKGYGIRKIEEILNVPISEMLFVGDALFEGGNDYPAKEAGVDCVAVSGVEETKEIIKSIIKE